MSEHQKLSEILALFEEHGQISFTREKILNLGYPDKALQVALWRFQSQGKIVSPARGFFVQVGVPYRKVGSPPPTWYLDAWMKFKNTPYYLGLLSAAAYHGATHHAVMESEVMVSHPILDQTVGTARFRFFVKNQINKTPRMSRETPAGTVEISTPAATLFDLVTYARRIGGIGTVATVIAELGDSVTLDELRSCLKSMPLKYADLQRTGYLLEKLSFAPLAAEIAEFIKDKPLHPIHLSCTTPNRVGERNLKWNIIENETIEVDI